MTDDELTDRLADATRAGERAAKEAAGEAPEDPLLRVAWFNGFDNGRLREAVEQARGAGVTWREIGLALGGKTAASVEAIYGRGPRRGQAWRQRKRGERD